MLAADDEYFQSIMAEILVMNGYNVIPANTTEEAERLFLQHRDKIDLILTDFDIPSCDGQKLCNRLSAIQPNLKALIMSGYIREWLLQEGRLEPHMPFIDKPFKPPDLISRIQDMLGGPNRRHDFSSTP